MKSLIVIAMLALTACQPPQRHVAANGSACHPIGYPWATVWVTPDNMRAC